MNDNSAKHGWFYAEKGDYHRNLNLDWSYAPTYLIKQKLVRKIILETSTTARILDAGCGEGVFVEEFQQKGYDIIGIDKNYSSEFVKNGDIRNLPFSEDEFDIVLLLDVLEHFNYEDQEIVLKELFRVLAPHGRVIISVPNIAHLNSRIQLLFTGQLDRSDSLIDHICELSLKEYQILFEKSGFQITSKRGITLSLPFLIQLIRHFPRKLIHIHNLLNYLAIPSLSQWILFDCVKER